MRLVLATRNAHKAEEIRAILSDRFSYLTLRDLPEAPEPVEDAATFEGNAVKKAATLARWLAQQPAFCREPAYVLADDSGLEVDALNGAPGVHSARYAALDGSGMQGRNSPDAANNEKLLRLLAGVPAERRTARFRCVVALISSEGANGMPVEQFAGNAKTYEGKCEGRIAFSPSGAGGFGYDPLFIPEGFDKSFAELGEDVKNQISHRARALQKLRDHLTSNSKG